MQQIISREQLWERLGQLDLFQQQTVAAFIDSLLASKTPVSNRDKNGLLTLSIWSEQDIALIQETQDRINAWSFPAS